MKNYQKKFIAENGLTEKEFWYILVTFNDLNLEMEPIIKLWNTLVSQRLKLLQQTIDTCFYEN